MKKAVAVRNYFILPCCLLLLNLVNNIISYKAELIADGFLRTTVVIFLVLAGSSLVAFVVTPAIAAAVRWLHLGSRRGAGELGEVFFLILLGVVVFWLYYRTAMHGTASILPAGWRNPKG